MGVGGSIPFISDCLVPDAAIVVTGVEHPDTRGHGANESLHLGELARSARPRRSSSPGGGQRG